MALDIAPPTSQKQEHGERRAGGSSKWPSQSQTASGKAHSSRSLMVSSSSSISESRGDRGESAGDSSADSLSVDDERSRRLSSSAASSPLSHDHRDRRRRSSSSVGVNDLVAGGVHGYAPKGGMGDELIRVLGKRQSRREVSHWEDNRCLSTKRLARAVYGPLLAIMERPGSTSWWMQLLTSRLLPGASLAVLFMQLNLLNGYALPAFRPRDIRFTYRLAELAFYLDLGPTVSVALTSSLLGLFMVLVPIIVIVFYRGVPGELMVSVLSGYIGLVCGPLYLPIFRSLLGNVVTRLGPGHESAASYVIGGADMACLLVFVPLSLFLTQNSFASDASTSSILRRKHNRLELLVIVIKTLAIFVSGCAWAILFLFSALLLAHVLTMVYYYYRVNRVVQGLYLGLVYGAVFRVAESYRRHDADESAPVDSLAVYYWMGLPMVFLLGACVDLTGPLAMTRFRVNSWLARNLSFLDLELEPRLIDDLDLSQYLHSASRLGRYADYLSAKSRQAKGNKHDTTSHRRSQRRTAGMYV